VVVARPSGPGSGSGHTSRNSQGNCVELAKLPDGQVALRNSRHPAGPALVYTGAEIEALLLGAKDGDFDDLVTGLA
jgi:hypothetical protein